MPHVFAEVTDQDVKIFFLSDALPHTVHCKGMSEPMAGWLFACLTAKRGLLKYAIKQLANRGVVIMIYHAGWEKYSRPGIIVSIMESYFWQSFVKSSDMYTIRFL